MSGTTELRDLLERTKAENGILSKNLPDFIAHVLYRAERKPDKLNAYAEQMGMANGNVPDVSYLLGVYAALHARGQVENLQPEITDLQKWLLYWLHGYLEKSSRRKALNLDQDYLNKWIDAAEKLKRNVREVKTYDREKLPTLDLFPDAFSPLTVITGTGPAYPPERIWDLFRANASMTDLFFLNELELPKKTRIVSDRFVIDMTAAKRVEHFGQSHLLLIGGPKVNAVTRALGNYGFFRFKAKNQDSFFCHLYDYLEEQDKEHSLFPDPDCIKVFYEFLENTKMASEPKKFQELLELVGDETRLNTLKEMATKILGRLGDSEKFSHKEIIKNFSPDRLVDPIHGLPLFTDHNEQREDAMITIAPNFYSRDPGKDVSFKSCDHRFMSIVVAGTERLGTAAALKKLAEPEFFASHPLGGFLEVRARASSPDFERYRDSKCLWNDRLTPSYTIEEFIQKVEDFPENGKNPALQIIAEEEGPDTKGLDNYLRFLRKFS